MSIENELTSKDAAKPKCERRVISVARLFGDPEDILKEELKDEKRMYDWDRENRRYGR